MYRVHSILCHEIEFLLLRSARVPVAILIKRGNLSRANEDSSLLCVCAVRSPPSDAGERERDKRGKGRGDRAELAKKT